MEITAANFKKVKALIMKLNNLADQRKACHDKLWGLENQTEDLRLELLELLQEKPGKPDAK